MKVGYPRGELHLVVALFCFIVSISCHGCYGFRSRSKLRVSSGRDLHSKLVSLPWRVSRLEVQESFSMGELKVLAPVAVSRDLVLSGINAEAGLPSINAGSCIPKVELEPDVTMKMEFLIIDIGDCDPGILVEVFRGQRGWLFGLDRGSREIYSRSTFLLQRQMLDAIRDHGGAFLEPGKPQNITLLDGEDLKEVVSFEDVVFVVKDSGNKFEESRSLGHTYNVTSNDQLRQALEEVSGDHQSVNVWVQSNLTDTCGRPLNARIHSQMPGSILTIKSALEQPPVVGCSLPAFISSVLLSSGFVSVEDLWFYTSQEFASLLSLRCRDPNCFRYSWASLFPALSGQDTCRVFVKNSTSVATCKTVAMMKEILYIAKSQWHSRVTSQSMLSTLDIPFVSMEPVSSLSFRIHYLKHEGLCMENVLISCNASLVPGELTPQSAHPVMTSNVVAILVPLVLAVALALFFCGVRAWCWSGAPLWGYPWHVMHPNHKIAEMELTSQEDISLYTQLSLDVVPPSTRSLELCKQLELNSTGTSLGSLGKVSFMSDANTQDSAWEISDDFVQIEDKIDSGGFGVVYRGKWKGLPVAIKTVLFYESAGGKIKGRQRAILEASISSSIAHNNIVHTFAYCFKPVAKLEGLPPSQQSRARRSRLKKPWKMFIVQEYCDQGSLRMALKRKLFVDPVTRMVNFHKILRVALDIAHGMEHLHSTGIIHGDLSSKNVFLKSETDIFAHDLTAKIGDFGLSVKVGKSEHPVFNNHAGTPFYVSPEVYHNGMLSKRADVFSFGVILWELFHHQVPFERIGKGPYKYHHRFPKFPVHCPMAYALLCIICLSPTVSNRPGFSFIVWVLEQLFKGTKPMQSEEEIERENLQHSPRLEGMGVGELYSFLKTLIGEPSALAAGAGAPSGEPQFREDVACVRLAISPRERTPRGSATERIAHVNHISTISTQHSQCEEHISQLIAAGMPLSVTVLPPGDSSVVGMWSGTQSVSLTHTNSSLYQTRGRSEIDSSGNAFSVVIDNGSFGGDKSISSCGELRFKWGPRVLSEKRPAVKKVVAPSPSGKLNKGMSPLSEGDSNMLSSQGEFISHSKNSAPIIGKDDVDNDGAGHRPDGLAEEHQNRGDHQIMVEPSRMSIVASMAVEMDQTGGHGAAAASSSSSSSTQSDMRFEYTTPPQHAIRPVLLSMNPLFAPTLDASHLGPD